MIIMKSMEEIEKCVQPARFLLNATGKSPEC